MTGLLARLGLFRRHNPAARAVAVQKEGHPIRTEGIHLVGFAVWNAPGHSSIMPGIILPLMFMAQAAPDGFPADQWFPGIAPLNSPGHTLYLATGAPTLYFGPVRSAAA